MKTFYKALDISCRSFATLAIGTISNGISAYFIANSNDNDDIKSLVDMIQSIGTRKINQNDSKFFVGLDFFICGFITSTLPALFMTTATKAFNLSGLQGNVLALPVIFCGYESFFDKAFTSENAKKLFYVKFSHISKISDEIKDQNKDVMEKGVTIIKESLNLAAVNKDIIDIYKWNTMAQTVLFNMIWDSQEVENHNEMHEFDMQSSEIIV